MSERQTEAKEMTQHQQEKSSKQAGKWSSHTRSQKQTKHEPQN